MEPAIHHTRYWNRETGRLEDEAIFGEGFVRFAYDNAVGRLLTSGLLVRGPFSKAYGAYQSTRWSARAVPKFIRRFGIRIEEYEDRPFGSFNDFFTRRFRPGARPFAPRPAFPAFAEGRYFAYEALSEATRFPIKGMVLDATSLLGDVAMARAFAGGPAFVARLCPTDYHRFHYPDAGKVLERRRVAGPLHSVALVALRRKPDVLCTNERRVAILETETLGKLAYVEVGALCVGKIVETDPSRDTFSRGDEKGYFHFGGSTVVVLGEPGRFRPDPDLLEKTREGFETFIRLGERIGTAAR